MKLPLTTPLALAFGLGVSALAMPAFADDMMDVSKMTCSDFMAMDADGQMAAVKAAQASAMMDGMSDDSSSSDSGSDSMSDGGMMTDDMVKSVTDACNGMPDMMITDAMMEGGM